MPERGNRVDVDGKLIAPHPSITFGITGHRLVRLDPAMLPAISTAAGALLDRIGAVSGIATPKSLRLVTALADGADSIFADAALARDWTVDAVLPFERSAYEGDFSEGPVRAAFTRRLAAARAVFELPGLLASDEGTDVAYERAGRVVLSQSDILIAVWDGKPARGRGGAAQIVAEAVLLGMPVIRLDPGGSLSPELLWDGLEAHNPGHKTVDLVPRSDLAPLPMLLRDLVERPQFPGERDMLDHFAKENPGRWRLASLAYPLLLAVMGVRRMRMADVRGAPGLAGRASVGAHPAGLGNYRDRLTQVLGRRFAHADTVSNAMSQKFRSGYVTNFAFAALAVVLSLLGLVLPSALKPVLIASEVIVIAVILLITRIGNRAGWHRRWLDYRHLAERLRCLTISAQLGDLDLRGDADPRPGWVGWYVRTTARELGLPNACVDQAYVTSVRDDLKRLIDEQVAYLGTEARRMHRLEHRLHLLGTTLFAATALVCLLALMFKVADGMSTSTIWAHLSHPVILATTLASAGLPAIGAAIYGIRMQGDFAGSAERSEAVAEQLKSLGETIDGEEATFDTLTRRARRATNLLTEDLASWLQTYHARPLALPG
jgi:hypothetical protein